jgi:large repetitive protein
MDFGANDKFGGAFRDGSDENSPTTHGAERAQLAQDGSAAAFAGTGRRAIANPDERTTVVLPEGATLSDLEVDGQNLIVTLPDGTQMVIVDAAIYDVDLVVQGTRIPDENWKDFLGIDDRFDPEAGTTRSSGGNFADPVLPIDDAFDIGNLLPYTELQFPTQDDVEVGNYQNQPNEEPVITGIPNVAESDAGTVVDEDGLPARDGDQGPEPAGTLDEGDGETTTGTIHFTSPDGVDQILIDGIPVFEIVDGQPVIIFPPTPIGPGTLVIVGVDLNNGTITYEYTLTDNTSGDGNTVDFDVTVVDPQGDSDTGNVVITIIDDVPVAVDDGNLATLPDEASGVVVGTVDGLVSNDDYGADGVGNPAITIGTGDHGGTITIVDGNLVYTPAVDVAPGETVMEHFTYTITDGDGSVSNTAEFTVTLTEGGPSLAVDAASIAVDEDGLPGGIAGGEGDSDGNATTATGTLAGLDFGPDGMGDIALAPSADTGLVTLAGNPVETVWDAATHTLTGQDAVTGEAIFTLTITDVATGAYEFTLLAPVAQTGAGEDDAVLSVQVTVTDGDGDSVTGNIALTINDDSPAIALTGVEAGVALLDESPLSADGIHSATIAFAGSFDIGFGADGMGSVSYALNLSGSDVGSGLFTLDGTEIVLNIADGVITGSADGTDYFTISVNAAGEVTFAFTADYANVTHADTGNSDDLVALIAEAGAITLTVTASDADGDTASTSIDLGTGIFVIGDDGPTITASANGEADAIALTSDAAITDSDTIDLSAIFSNSADYGTDGAGTLIESYGLALTGTDSGLTSGGLPITLSIDGNVVTGATADGAVFTIAVDPETGLLTLTQSAAIDHAMGSDLAVLANGLVQATYVATITDADGDSASSTATIDLGGNIAFADDAPVIVVGQDAVRAPLDESPLAADGIASVTVDFGSKFAVSAGNDGLDSASFALSLNGSDVGSGLYALDGTEIVLNLVGNVVTGSAGGTDYFTITLDPVSGSVTFAFTADYANIRHPDGSNADDGAVLQLADGIFALVASATDGDGDTVTALVDLGNGIFVIQDDGPVAADDTGFTVTTPSLDIDVFANDSAGTDGVDLATGVELTTGPAKGSVTYNGDGTFTYTANPGATGADSFTYTITDADGDTSTATVTLTIDIDTAPVITSADDATVDEDGLPAANADSGQTDPSETPSTGQAVTTGTIVVDYDSDVPADPHAAFAFTNVDALDGSISSGGQPVDFALDASGNIVGTIDGGATTAITIALTDVSAPVDGSVTYGYSVTLLQPVDHPVGGSEDAVTIPGIGFTVTDSDGTQASGSFSATITDDVPSAAASGSAAPVLVVDDSTLGTDASADFSGAFDLVAGADGAANVTYTLGIAATGADSGLTDTATGDAILLYLEGGVVVGRVGGEAGDIAFTVSVDANGTVTLDQQHAIAHGDPSDPVEAAPDAAESLASAGLVTLTASITDGDGDSASATLNIGQTLLFEDDGPAITATACDDGTAAQTSDAALPGSDAGSLNLGALFGYTGADYGADGAGSISESFALTLLVAEGSASGLTSGGAAINLFISDDGLTVTGSTAGSEGALDGGNIVFTVTLGADGTVTLSQMQTIDHAPGSDVATLADGLIGADYTVTITDGDGDSVTDQASVDLGGNLAFGDDAPTVIADGDVPSVLLDESLVAPAGDGIWSVTTDFSSQFTFTDSADGPNAASYALELAADGIASGLFALDGSDVTAGDGDGIGQGDPILLSMDGGDVVGMANGVEYFRISLDEATGEVTFTRSENIWHPQAGLFELKDDGASIELPADVLKLTATITDSDGDSDSASIDLGNKVFTIEDDGPSVDPSTKYTAFELSGTDDYALIAHGNLNFKFGTDGMLGGSLGTSVVFEILNSSSVDGVTLTHIDQPVYDAVDGVWKFSFDYIDSNGQTGSNSGEISYDGSNFQLTLADSFEFTSVVSVAGAVNSTTYEVDGVSNGQSEILVNELDNGTDDPIFVQFTGFAGGLNAGGDNVLSSGESVTGTQTWISTSNAAFGVAGDTIQKGEVLDMKFHSLDPYQYDFPATSFVSGLTFTLDGVNGSEDFIVILKLADPNDPGTILETRAVIVGADDIYRNSDTIPDGFDAPVLDNNDGFVIIEANDYLQGGEAYVIVGAQLMSSSSGLSGSGIDLNRATGDAGASTGTTAFGSDTDDNDVVKISDIGLIRSVIDEQAVSLDLKVTVTDADGDQDFTNIFINPFGDPIVLDMNGDGFHFQSLDNGVMYDINGDGVLDQTAWIAAGDAILVRDANGNGIVDDASEFIFHEDGLTDLQTLHALYGDVLDASDADFGQFGIWMDNGDGIFQSGEFMTLAEAGITDISLVSDGNAGTAIDGEVRIVGTGSFNGGTGSLVDAAFRYQLGSKAPAASSGDQRSQEMATIAASAAALMASSAAQAEPYFLANRMVNFEETGRDHLFAQDNGRFQPETDVQGFAQVSLGTPVAASVAGAPQVHAMAANDLGSDAGLAVQPAPAAHEIVGLGASTQAAADFAADHGAPANDAGSAQMMALLQLSAQPVAEGAQGHGQQDGSSLGAVREALSEVTGNDAVSHLVNQIIDSAAADAQGASTHDQAPSSPGGQAVHDWGAGDLAALLNGQVAGAGHGATAPMDHGDDAAMLAAAAH